MKKALLISTLLVGSYFTHAQETISLVGELQFSNLPIHDVWGYTNESTGKKYALLGASTSGLRVIDLSDITNPVAVGSIIGKGIEAIDVKTWKNYAYIVGESLSTDGNIIDLSDPTNPIKVGTFLAGHNITISIDGFLYLSSPGLRIFDLNFDPIKPTMIYSDLSCDGHDISIVGGRLFDFSGNCGTRIFEILQDGTLDSIGSVPSLGIFHHSGWPSNDGNYLYICDELASPNENDITIWDISNLSKPMLVDSFSDPNAYVHNLYVHNNYAYVSYYRAGFRLFNILNPLKMVLVDQYDTDTSLSGPGYGGNFGLFTFWGSDTILASDEETGLYIFSVSELNADAEQKKQYEGHIASIFPNPAGLNTTVSYSIGKRGKTTIYIQNLQGQVIGSWDEGIKEEGSYHLPLPTDGLANGLYLVKITQGGTSEIIKLLIEE